MLIRGSRPSRLRRRLLVQGKVALDLGPSCSSGGCCWCPRSWSGPLSSWPSSADCGKRYATYGVGLGGAVAHRLLPVHRPQMTWMGNWWLWSAVRWSDIGIFELDRTALVLNRLLALGLAGLLHRPRRAPLRTPAGDAIGSIHRLRPRAAAGAGAAALAASPSCRSSPASRSGSRCDDGYQGAAVEKKEQDYWKKNLATWKDAPQPASPDVELDLRSIRTGAGSATRAVRAGQRPRDAAHALRPHRRPALEEGELDAERQGVQAGGPRPALRLHAPDAAAARRARAHRLPVRGRSRGHQQERRRRDGVHAALGRGADQLHPRLRAGRRLHRGDRASKRTRTTTSPRVYPDDFYEGKTEAPSAPADPFTDPDPHHRPGGLHLQLGRHAGQPRRSENGRRHGGLAERPSGALVQRGRRALEGEARARARRSTTTPSTPTTSTRCSAALDAARRCYSEWFQPFPWSELKLSEFPGLASYAQGFPTNITFSEKIGFLTKSDAKADASFMVTAHEAAHQWWGNMLMPGEGPGGDVLSEGMSHFSTLLLTEQARARGAHRVRQADRGAVRRRPARRRRAPAGQDGRLAAGRPTVTYDKGGWVVLDAATSRWAASATWPACAKFIADLGRRAGPPGAPGLPRGHAPVRARHGGLRRLREAVVPRGRGARVPAERRPQRRRAGAGWKVDREVKNVGTGAMPVEVAATRGERFTAKRQAETAWRDARARRSCSARARSAGRDRLRLRAREGGGRSRRHGAQAAPEGGGRKIVDIPVDAPSLSTPDKPVRGSGSFFVPCDTENG